MLCNFDALVHHFLAQLCIGRIGDVFLLDRRVDNDFALHCIGTMKQNRLFEDEFGTVTTDTVTEMDKLTRIKRGNVLKDRLTREVLPVRILHPTGH